MNSYCKRCGMPILWLKTVAGKVMPVDVPAIPFVEDGQKTFVDASGAVVRGRFADETDKEEDVKLGYISHFATCPYAGDFRKRTKKGVMKNGVS